MPGTREARPDAARTEDPPLRLGLLIGTFLAWLPALMLAASLAASSALDCRVDEGSAHPCLLLGADIGGLLYTGFTMGWLLLVTLPFMAITLLLWIALGLRALWRRR
jgi:hypothetical protein